MLARDSQKFTYKIWQVPPDRRNLPHLPSTCLILVPYPDLIPHHLRHPLFDMVPKILRALKAILLRRKPTTSPSCPTAPSFHAEPQYSRAADNLHHTPLGSSYTRNLMLASASDAMLATAHLAEIVALFPGDDDSCYEESVPLDYTSDSDSDSVSMFSSMTSESSFDEFEGVVRCLNGMCFFTRA